MKKYTLFTGLIFLFVFLNKNVKAQITINQSDLPVIGSSVVMAVDTSGLLLPQGASNTAQVWNYASLQKAETNSYLFVNPANTKYFPYFPSSNLADSLIYAPGYTYLLSSPTTFSALGYGEVLMGFAVGLAIHPSFVQIPLPATLGTTDGGVSRGDTAVAYSYLGSDSAGAKINIHYADTVDAFGTMTTPYGTETVIRQKHYDITVDSLGLHIPHVGWTYPQITTTKDYVYRWYAKGVGYYFATMQMNHTNTKDSVVQWYDGAVAGIDNISNSQYTTVYPNPCQTQVTFNCSSLKAKQVSVFDMTGRELSRQEMNNGMLIMSTSSYPAGMYFYRISDIAGNVLDRGKFIVQ